MIDDLNDNQATQKKYPDSVNYGQYYDGLDEHESMPGDHLPELTVNGGRERFLKQDDSSSEIKKL